MRHTRYDMHTDKALYVFTALVFGAFFWGCAMAGGLIDAASKALAQ